MSLSFQWRMPGAVQRGEVDSKLKPRNKVAANLRVCPIAEPAAREVVRIDQLDGLSSRQ